MKWIKVVNELLKGEKDLELKKNAMELLR